MSRNQCEPAASIIDALGGMTALAVEMNLAQSTVLRWRSPGPDGRDGYIPRKYHPALTAMARERGIVLSPAAFVDAHAARRDLAAREAAE
jgi:hypothetical protein